MASVSEVKRSVKNEFNTSAFPSSLCNESIGEANALDEKQIVLLEDGIACLDVYLKIEKLNAMLAEQNIPIVVCIAFVSEIIIHSPLSIEINGLDLVIQTTPYNFSKHSVITGATIIFRDLQLRLQCPLTLAGVHRACDLQLRIHLLEFTNASPSNEPDSASTAPSSARAHQSRTEHPKTGDVSGEQGNSARLWSWLWNRRWTSSEERCRDPPSGSSGLSNSDHTCSAIPTILTKNIRMDDVTVHWDLWDTSVATDQQTTCSSAASLSRSQSSRGSSRDRCLSQPPAPSSPKGFFIGPTAESMIASACLLTLPMEQNFVSVCMRDPAFVSKMLSPTTSDNSASVPGTIASAVPSDHPSNLPFGSSGCGGPTLLDLSIDLGPLIVCACPSELFWLHLMLTQLTSLWEAFAAGRWAQEDDSTSQSKNQVAAPVSAAVTMTTTTASPRHRRCTSSENLLQSLAGAPNEAPAHHFVDLDLSGNSPDQRAISPSPSMIDSRMFRTCMNVAEYNEDFKSNPDQGGMPFSFSGRCRFFYLLLLLDDEEAATTSTVGVKDQSESELHPQRPRLSSAPLSRLSSLEPAPGSASEADASSEEQFHEALSDISPVGGDVSGDTNGSRSSRLNSNTNHANFSLMTSPAALESIAHFFARLRDNLSLGKTAPPDGDPADPLRQEISLSLLFNFTEAFRRKKLSARDWVVEVSSRLSEMAAPASHLCLSLGLCQAEANFDSPTDAAGDDLNVGGGGGGGGGPEPMTGRTKLATAAVAAAGVGGELRISAQANGLLLSECLFLPDDSNVNSVVPSVVQTAPPGGDPADPLQQEISLSLLFNFTEAFRRKKFTARDWVAEVSSRLSEMAAPASHLCLSLGLCQAEANFDSPTDAAGDDLNVGGGGGGGGPEPLSRKTTSATAAVAAAGVGGELRISAQANGLLLSECLFLPDDSNVDSVVPSVVQLLTFDDSGASSSSPAVRLHLLTAASASQPSYCGLHDCDSSPLYCRSPIRFQLAPCSIELDPSLCDRVHRLVDALTEAQQVAANIVVTESFSEEDTRVRTWLSAGKHATPVDMHPTFARSACFKMRRPARHTGASKFGVMQGLPLRGLVCGPDLENTAFLRLLDRPGSGRPSVFVRVAPLGRQHLDEQDLRTDVLSHYHRTASPLGTAGDEGVASKLRSASVEVATSSEVRAEAKLSDAQPTHNGRSIEEMEEELLQRVAPKENRRTPFVYRKTFLENDAQCHWDKASPSCQHLLLSALVLSFVDHYCSGSHLFEFDYFILFFLDKLQTVLPGNADHMAGYRSLATQQSRILVDMSAPLVILNLPNDRVTTLIYTRAFHDLSLWHSLFPSDRRIRACLRRPRPGSPSTTVGSLLADHRYWFLSEPAPFISIYALPQAAAEREANLRYHASETGTLATTHGRLFDPSFESDDSSVGALSDSDPQPSSKKPNRHVGDKDLADGLHGLRHQQSLLFLNLFFDHVEARTRLTPILGLATDVPSAQAVLLARHVRITHEVEPSGQVDLKYSTVDIRNFDCHVLDSFDVKSQQEGTGGLHESKNNIPLLRPFVNPVFPKQTDENSLSEESMLSIAFESTTRPPTVTADKANKAASPTVMEELCVSICLRRACLILWPKLDGWSPQVAACGTSPCWLQRIVDSLSPKVDLAAEYPSFTPPSYSVKQHFHLQEVGVTWPPSSAFTFCEVSPFYSGDSDQPPSTLSDVHPLIVLGETSFYGKVVEPANPQSSGCEASSLVGFIQNAVFWLIPPQEPSPSKRDPSATGSIVTTTRLAGSSRRRKMFSDPAACGSTPPTFALTIFDFSLEWTFFGGSDFLRPLSQGEGRKREPSSRVSVSTCTPSTDSRVRVTPRPDIVVSSGEERFGRQALTPSATSLGTGRQPDKSVVVCLTNIYFRKSVFPKSSISSTDASRASTSAATDSLDHHSPTTTTSHRPSAQQCLPLTRYALRVADLRIVDRVSSSRVNRLLHARRLGGSSAGCVAGLAARPREVVRASLLFQPTPPSALLLAEDQHRGCSRKLSSGCGVHCENFNEDLEAEIKLSVQPLQVNLDQGALVGFLALCLQLNNAELILPRRVYQRGYLGVSSLLEEIFADVTNSIQSQLPHVLLSSVGPMHEVTNIVHGVWDLVHKSIDGLRRHPSDSILTRLGNRDAYVCTRCRSVIQPDQKRTCACSRLGLPLTLSNPEHFIYGLRSGVRSFSANAIWSTLELSAQSVRVIQSLFETAYDILTPGPSIRHRQARLRQPADLREGLSNAVHAVVRGVNLITSDFRGVMQGPVGTVDPLNKGSVGALGDVLRQIPPAMVTPLVAGCEATANILGGLRNQMRPEAKLEDEEKWKDTHGL
nr:unnamed protein product [Spirometra erinaceieuropaei]